MPKYLGKISRRDFFKAGTCGAMTIGPLVNTIAQLSLINSASASALGGTALVGSDYKALVCIFLRGGCDMNNVLIPVGSNSQAASYALDRGSVAIPNGIAHSYNPSGANETLSINVPEHEPFGLHPSLSNLAAMFNANEASFICNVGTLAEPTTQNDYSTSSLPKQLFSHSDQVTQWMSSISDKPYTSGWGARVAELYNDTWNLHSQTSMLITAAGNNQFMNGSNRTPQYSVTSTGAISLTSFGTNYSNAIGGDGYYRNSAQGERLKALETIMQYSHAHILEEGYSEVIRSARANEAIISEAVQVEQSLGIDFDSIFEGYGAIGGIGDELKAVARLIAGRECLGNNRQIFFVDLGGFDNHQDINNDLPTLLSQLDNAIGAFNAGMKELDARDPSFDYNKVTTFQASDFNRTWTPNGTNIQSAGTDHAWGSHSFVFGGAVNGGQFYGTFPELTIGGSNDVPSSSRGRWIPTTAVDQFAAVMANWFGVPNVSSEMEAIFPNLYRFQDPFSVDAKLGFL